MKIFLTGGNGMVGKNIQNHPAAKNHQITAPSSKELDLTDYNSTLEYIKSVRPDVVIHSAGLVGGIQANIKNPVNFLKVNMDVGRNIVLASREAEVRKLLNLGSSCMYPKDAENPLKEEYILTGTLEPTNEGYAIAKIATAKLAEYIHREDSEYLYKTIIPCNLYGSYDKFNPEKSHMIPAVIRKISEAIQNNIDTVEIWGDGLSRREFMHAEDLAEFIFYALENFEKLPDYLNVGLGYDYSINEYYQTVAEVLGYSGKFHHDLSKPAGMKQKLVDVTALHNYGWKSKIDLKTGIEKTYNYFKNLQND